VVAPKEVLALYDESVRCYNQYIAALGDSTKGHKKVWEARAAFVEANAALLKVATMNEVRQLLQQYVSQQVEATRKGKGRD
jgi:hypothetical protein